MSPSAFDIYELYLRAEDLGGKPHTIQLGGVQARDAFNPSNNKNEKKLAFRIPSLKRTMILNKTQVRQIAKITRTDNYDQWRGWITLTPAKARSGKDTITISAANQADIPPPRAPEKIINELCPQ